MQSRVKAGCTTMDIQFTSIGILGERPWNWHLSSLPSRFCAYTFFLQRQSFLSCEFLRARWTVDDLEEAWNILKFVTKTNFTYSFSLMGRKTCIFNWSLIQFHCMNEGPKALRTASHSCNDFQSTKRHSKMTRESTWIFAGGLLFPSPFSVLIDATVPTPPKASRPNICEWMVGPRHEPSELQRRVLVRPTGGWWTSSHIKSARRPHQCMQFLVLHESQRRFRIKKFVVRVGA